MHISPSTGRWEAGRFSRLPEYFVAGDVLVLNDAATHGASLRARTERGTSLEVRVAAWVDPRRRTVALLGAGDWRTPTEHRQAPPRLSVGDRLQVDGRGFVVQSVDDRSHRLVVLEGDASDWAEVLRRGRPVQYSYLERDLSLGDVQTPYAHRRWASEMPSAGRALSWSILLALKRRGVEVVFLTHAAGLSSVDGGTVDAMLPMPERTWLPRRTADTISDARRAGRRIVAVGTTVVRSLEGILRAHGRLQAGEYTVDLILGPEYRLQVTDGLLTNLHVPGESHFELLAAFAPRGFLLDAMTEAAKRRWFAHEFGDASLILDATG
jgi:S-adenosylmethionine:tRNA ribosyltransferase-isomerase